MVALGLGAGACAGAEASGGAQDNATANTTATDTATSGADVATTGAGTTGADTTTTSTGGASSGGLSVHEFERQFAALQCENVYRCCNAEELAANAEDDSFFVGPDLETCLTRNAESGAAFADRIVAWETAGQVRFEPAVAQGCLDRYTNIACQNFPSYECDAVSGLVELGGECDLDYHCSEGVCLFGECAAPLPLGEACSDLSDCESGVCDFFSFDPSRVCIPKLENGEVCEYHFECLSNFCDEACSETTSTCWVGH